MSVPRRAAELLDRIPRPRIQARSLAVIAAVAATWLTAWSMPRDFRVGNYVDDAHYAVLAKSLRTGQGYRTLNLPGQPPETKYPPGFPLLLASGWDPARTDAENLDRLRSVNLWLVGAVAAALTLLGTQSRWRMASMMDPRMRGPA